MPQSQIDFLRLPFSAFSTWRRQERYTYQSHTPRQTKRAMKQRPFSKSARKIADLGLAIDEARKEMLNGHPESNFKDAKSIDSRDDTKHIENEILATSLAPQQRQSMTIHDLCAAEHGSVKLAAKEDCSCILPTFSKWLLPRKHCKKDDSAKKEEAVLAILTELQILSELLKQKKSTTR